jgi:hypothetical protein
MSSGLVCHNRFNMGTSSACRTRARNVIDVNIKVNDHVDNVNTYRYDGRTWQVPRRGGGRKKNAPASITMAISAVR